MLIYPGKKAFHRLIAERKGYSLIEIMITVAIIGIISSVGSHILINFTRFQALNAARASIQRDARISIDAMNRHLRQGVASSITVDQVTNQPPYSRINFQTVEGKIISYYQNNKELIQDIDGLTSTLSKDLRYIAFAYQNTWEDDIISISISLEKGTYEAKTSIFKLSIEKVRIMN
ncbi:MAG: prepilin-type N-terminal cleavage/methylation domain-containing protein [bacterium]